MSILGSMKSKLGFSNDGRQDDDGYDYGYDEQHDEGYDNRCDDRYTDEGQSAGRRDGDEERYHSSNLDSQVRVVPRGSRSESNSTRYGASAYGSKEFGTRPASTSPSSAGRQRSYDRGQLDAAPFETSRGSYNAPNPMPGSDGRERSASHVSSVTEPEFMRNRMSSADSASAALEEVRSQRPTARVSRSDHQGSSFSSKLDIIKPLSYNEAEKIAVSFKSGNNVALSLAAIRPELAKRILDFSFGVVSALGGSVEKVSDKVFMLSHSSVGITADEERRLRDAGVMV